LETGLGKKRKKAEKGRLKIRKEKKDLISFINFNPSLENRKDVQWLILPYIPDSHQIPSSLVNYKKGSTNGNTDNRKNT